MEKRSISLFIMLLLTLTLVGFTGVPEAEAQEVCLTCHAGIEDITDNQAMAQALKAMGGECSVCHLGNPEGKGVEEVHQGLIKNPSSLHNVDKTCGKCHNEVTGNVMKSLHATSAGKISGARYTWGAQEDKLSMYGNKPIKDLDGNVPTEKGALAELKLLPFYSEEDAAGETEFKDQVQVSGNPVDSYLRKECLRCHIWTEGRKGDGDWRADGCAACHVIYADDGLSKSGEKAIDKEKKGRPIQHKITTQIPASQCAHCHNRGARIGVSFLGMMENDYNTPFAQDGSDAAKLHGKNYAHLDKNLHFDAGMQCIDCHTGEEIMGDGNIYSKRYQAVTATCAMCHGDEKNAGKKEITLKMTGEVLQVPQINKETLSETNNVAMLNPKHMEKLTCSACHAKWTPQCYGCHAKFDEREKQKDQLTGAESTGKWQESRSYLRWESVILGFNSDGKISPFVPGCQVIFTHIDKDGNTIESNKVFKVNDPDAGHEVLGWALNPISPHTIQKNARTCSECHSSSKAVGLGSGYYNAQNNGVNVDIPVQMDQLIDENGKQLQTISHPGARPFTLEEIERIQAVNYKDIEAGSTKEETSGFDQKIAIVIALILAGAGFGFWYKGRCKKC